MSPECFLLLDGLIIWCRYTPCHTFISRRSAVFRIQSGIWMEASGAQGDGFGKYASKLTTKANYKWTAVATPIYPSAVDPTQCNAAGQSKNGIKEPCFKRMRHASFWWSRQSFCMAGALLPPNACQHILCFCDSPGNMIWTIKIAKRIIRYFSSYTCIEQYWRLVANDWHFSNLSKEDSSTPYHGFFSIYLMTITCHGLTYHHVIIISYIIAQHGFFA